MGPNLLEENFGITVTATEHLRKTRINLEWYATKHPFVQYLVSAKVCLKLIYIIYYFRSKISVDVSFHV